MLRSVPSYDEPRALLMIVEWWRQTAIVLFELLFIPLVGVVLLLSGLLWGGLLIGAAIGLALSRYGPHWWPGKR